MQRGNDRTCNPFFRVILAYCSIALYLNVDQIVACINHQVFSGTVRSMSAGPQSWNRRALVDLYALVGTLVGRFLLGDNVSVENVANNYRWSSMRIEQGKEQIFAVKFNNARRSPANPKMFSRQDRLTT